jgi:hypothetical protein
MPGFDRTNGNLKERFLETWSVKYAHNRTSCIRSGLFVCPYEEVMMHAAQ